MFIPEGGVCMKKNRYAEPVRQTYAKESKMERFKFKDKLYDDVIAKSHKSKKKKRRKFKSAG